MPKLSTDATLIAAVAAELGLHPQTIRLYERRGLLTPRRSPGGTRLFGPDEYARLRRIQELTALNHLAAISYVLALERELEQLRRQRNATTGRRRTSAPAL